MIELEGDWVDGFGRHLIISEHPHTTDAGAYPYGWKLEWADGQVITVDTAETAIAYVETLGLKKV